MLQEERRSARDWVDLVPAVQWALNTAYRERYGSTPYHVMFGRAPKTFLSTLASSTSGDWQVNVLGATALRRHVRGVVDAQVALHKEVSLAFWRVFLPTIYMSLRRKTKVPFPVDGNCIRTHKCIERTRTFYDSSTAGTIYFVA